MTVFDTLTPPYSTIVADPPWHYAKVNPDNPATGYFGKGLPYSSMTLDEIRALPVASIAAPDARVFLWVTNRYLRHAWDVTQKPDAFGDLVEAWSPGPYVELFARAPRLGWDSWGKGYEIAEHLPMRTP